MKLWEYLDRRAERLTTLAATGEQVRGFNIRDLIGLVLIGSFIGAIGMMFQVAIPRDNKDLLTYMLGQLSGFVAAVVALHYVTKAGEKELDQTRAANTGKAMDAMKAAIEGTGTGGEAAPAGTEEDPLKTEIVNKPHDPVPTTKGKPV